MPASRLVWLAVPALVFVACGGDSGNASDASASDATLDVITPVDASDASVDSAPPIVIPTSCNGSVASTSTTATGLPAVPAALTVAAGFKMEVVGAVGGARELAALPNGDLLVATNGNVSIIPNAEADGAPGKVATFATAPDTSAAGITYVPTTCAVYLGTNQGVYTLTYTDGQLTGTFGAPIAKVRQGSIVPKSDGDVHKTTSVAFANNQVFASVGSGCNACSEIDPTRASIQVMNADGSNMTTRATQIRNAIAITTNPATGTVWAGGAGQDDICDNFPTLCPNGSGHPYEFFDAVTSHTGVANYGWPACEENHNPFGSNADCSNAVAPLIELPAYSTLIGASFYPPNEAGAYAFPSSFHGGVFITAHGSWHTKTDGSYFSSPLVVFVAMSGDVPATAVDWNDPTKQWSTFVGGWQDNDSTTRHGRPTGVAIGSKGSLFVGDDSNGLVYRIRPK
jgi:glucose/arabinose dehydrogenase